MDEKQTAEHGGQDISDLLREADAENERARQEQLPPSDHLTKTIVAPAIGAGSESSPDDSPPHRLLNAETIELIDQYSTREIHDEKSDTQELREALARNLQGDKLLGFLDQKKQSGAPKAENLRELIRESDRMSAQEMEERAARTAEVAERFSDEEELPPNETFSQEEMFPLGDGLTMKEGKRTKLVSGYDRDYEKLGEKVMRAGAHEEQVDQEQLSFLPEETDVEPINPEMDETELNLRLAFDMMENDDIDVEERSEALLPQKRRRIKQRSEEPLLKYTSHAQDGEFAEKLQAQKREGLIRLVIAVVLAMVLWYVEASGEQGGLGFLLHRGLAGVRLYLLLDLQLLFACGLVVLPSLVRGLRGLFSRKLVPESLLAIGLLFAAVYQAVLIVQAPPVASLRLYGVTMGFAAVCTALAEVQMASRAQHAFRMIASKRPKYIAERVTDPVKESEAFGRYLYEDSELYTVRRTEFVDDFTARVVGRPKYNDLLHFLVPLLLVCALGLAGAMLLLGRSATDAFYAASAMIALSMPSAAFFLISLPLTAANRKGKKCSGAFLGNRIAEEYSMASALSFADTEVFPSNMVNITSVKTYGDYRIDKVIPEVAKVFSFLGGPLAKVTERMMDGAFDRPTSARVIENVADGICVAVDGKHIFLGKRSYLRRYRFDAPVDQGDEGYEKGVGGVMYVVIDEQLAAKFYVRYRINPRFEQLLQDLYRANLCLGVKTMDPNITNELLANCVRFHKCPVAVLKQDEPSAVSGNTEHASSGVVCNSSLHNFLRMFSLCDKVRHVTKCNAIITTVSVVLSAAAVAFLAVTGNLQAFGPTRALLFQCCWQVPIWVLSFLAV